MTTSTSHEQIREDADASGERGERVLILAPRGRNAPLLDEAMRKSGFKTHICRDATELCDRVEREPVGSVVLCEEGLDQVSLGCLVGILGQQPPWSEVPLLVLTGGGHTTRGSAKIARELGPRGNVTLLERPVRVITLLSAVRAGLRTRRRQYEMRDLLARERAARADAEAANRAKDHFLATLSHELRTPLNPVLLTVSALADDPSILPEIREELDVVRHGVELEARLIDDLLDLTRIARGKLELHREIVDLHAVISRAAADCCESDVTRKQLTIVRELQATDHYVWGDVARLSQIFWNLVGNGVKFTSEQGRIRLTTRAAGDGTIEASVSDDGIGMDTSALSRVFDAFEQGSRGVTRRHGGLGLGLAICKALVELHGGTIKADSPGPDQGATFTVRLPVVDRPHRGRANSSIGHLPAVASKHETRVLNILLVEDHGVTGRVMARLLRSAGHRVTLTASVAATRQVLYEDVDFDLLLSDLGLPDGNGLEVLEIVRASGFDIPAIAISGYGTEDDERQSREAGFAVHLTKPIDVARLFNAINEIMRP